MDFIFGKKEESNLNQRSQALNDLLLDEILKQYQQGPNPLPTYTAMAPDLAYSAPNTLLASLGLGQVARPDLPTTEIGGRTVYSSAALQKAMEEKFAAENPELYARLKREMQERLNPAPVAVATASQASNDDDDGYSYDPITSYETARVNVPFQDDLRNSFGSVPFVGEYFGGPITAENPASTGGYGSLVTGGPSAASKDVFAAAKEGSKKPKNIFSSLFG